MSDTKELIEPLPEGARFDAYYYGFEPTGVGVVDAILSAVAVAGKGAHSTESWGEASHSDDYYRNRPGLVDGDSAEDLIQKNANQSAEAIRESVNPTAATEDELLRQVVEFQGEGEALPLRDANGRYWIIDGDEHGFYWAASFEHEDDEIPMPCMLGRAPIRYPATIIATPTPTNPETEGKSDD